MNDKSKPKATSKADAQRAMREANFVARQAAAKKPAKKKAK